MSRTICRQAAAIAVLCVAVPPAAAGQAQPFQSPVRAEIVASAPTASDGGTAWLGVRLVMNEGWHVYWTNPGDSGGPPTVHWELPRGLAAGPLLWPLPERIPFDRMVNFGYHGDVVLPVRLTADGGRWPAAPFTVKAQVKWVACRDICVPGRAAVSKDLPAGFTTSPGSEGDLLRRAVAQVPAPAPRAWRLSGASTGDTFTVVLETGRNERDVTFFPLVSGQVEAAAPVEAKPTPRGATLTLRKSAYLSKPIASLKGVIVVGGRGYAVDVPLRPAPSRPPAAGNGRRQLPPTTRSPR